MGTAASPGSQTRVPGTLGRESHALAEALGHGGPDRGAGSHMGDIVAVHPVILARRFSETSKHKVKKV